MRRRRAVAGLAATVVILLTAGSTGAAGPDSPQSLAQIEATGSVSLSGQTTSVRPGGFFDLDLRVAGVGVRHTIDVEVHRAVASRIEFLSGLRPGAERDDPIHVLEAGPIAELRPANTDLISVRVRTSPADDPVADTAPIASGVYPVRVVLRHPDTTPVAELTTHLIAVPPEDDTEPLAVGLFLGFDPPVALGPTEQIRVDADTRSVLRSWADALEPHPQRPVTWRVPGETIDALFRSGTDDDTATFEALRTIAPQSTFLADTFVDVDDEAWREIDAQDHYDELRRRDVVVLTEHLPGATIDARTRPVAPTDVGATLLWLDELGMDRALTTADRLDPLDPDRFPVTVTRPFVLEHADGAVEAIGLDTVSGAHLGASGSPILDAHRTLADLTVLALDEPDRVGAVVVAPPTDRIVDPTYLTTLINGIDRSRLLEHETIDRLFDLEPANAGGNGPDAELAVFPLVRRLGPADEPTSVGGLPSQLDVTRADLASYETVVGTNSPLSTALRDLLAVVGARQFEPDERDTYLDTVRTQLARSTSAVTLDAQQSVSLTSRQADVPVSVTNDLGVPVRVQLVLESDKLDFPGGDVIEHELETGTSVVEIPVRARTSGDAILEITPRSPDGRLLLGDAAQVTVRSTVLSGLGIVISVVALAVLLTWWARQVISRRRSSR